MRRGKRSGVFGAFLLAVHTGDGEEFQTISKIGTGFSEEQLRAFSEQLRGLTIPAPKPYYRRAAPSPPCPSPHEPATAARQRHALCFQHKHA